jgi:hypothetical protein
MTSTRSSADRRGVSPGTRASARTRGASRGTRTKHRLVQGTRRGQHHVRNRGDAGLVMRIDEKRIRSLRMRAQRLTAPIRNSVPDVVRHMVGLQAQDTRMTRLLVRPRASGVDAASVDRACQDASVVRTWAMRGTLHMVAAEDLRWLVDLLGPTFIARSRPRRRQLGLPRDELCGDATGHGGASGREAALPGCARRPGPRSRRPNAGRPGARAPGGLRGDARRDLPGAGPR